MAVVWGDVGWGPTQATIRRGVRWSTYRAYLRRMLHEDNIHMLTQATALKVCPLGAAAAAGNRTNDTIRYDVITHNEPPFESTARNHKRTRSSSVA